MATQTGTATIALNASLSDSVDVWLRSADRAMAILMPTNWTPADLTFQVSWDNTTFYNFGTAEDGEFIAKAEADQWVNLGIDRFPGVRYIKIRSGTRYAPIAQLGARSLGIALLPVG